MVRVEDSKKWMLYVYEIYPFRSIERIIIDSIRTHPRAPWEISRDLCRDHPRGAGLQANNKPIAANSYRFTKGLVFIY